MADRMEAKHARWSPQARRYLHFCERPVDSSAEPHRALVRYRDEGRGGALMAYDILLAFENNPCGEDTTFGPNAEIALAATVAAEAFNLDKQPTRMGPFGVTALD